MPDTGTIIWALRCYAKAHLVRLLTMANLLTTLASHPSCWLHTVHLTV
jgi:hypothetical protein